MKNKIKIEKLKKIIAENALITDWRNKSGNSSWIFDFRNIFFKPETLDLIADIFWDLFKKEYPFQISGQEFAAIPLVSAIVMKSQQNKKPLNGFIIRKSRKPTGTQKLIEGEITDEKIILVDDLMNSGTTILRQIKILENLDKKVDAIFSLIRFRDLEYYKPLTDKGIKIISLFTLDDFNIALNDRKEKIYPQNFKIIWYAQSPNPNYFHIVPKSAPIIDNEKVYFGSDNGYFWAINQTDGSAAWKYKIGFFPRGKAIFSTPIIYENTIYFGAYDGNVYALDSQTGKRKWTFFEADWVGSSPAIAPDLNLLFIGLEFGLFKKQGGIAALDIKTGKKKWEYIMPEYIHSSPAYCPEKKVVAVGCNDFNVYLFDAKNGKLKWQFKTEGEIKYSFAFNPERNLVLFGSFDGNLYALDIDSGEIKGKFQTQDKIYSTPLIHKDNVYFGSLDKNLYSVNLDTGKLNWKFAASGRFFANPVIIDEKIYIGATDGRMYEIDIETGKLLDFFQATERITNKIAYNPQTKRFFLPTYANEIYCLEKKN